MDRALLKELYEGKHKSAAEIAALLGCSNNRVVYWMKKHGIHRRSISDAVYARCNPNGDPFKFIPPKSHNEAVLFGLGIGLYWGEGTKANAHTVRLGNTDPALLRKFIEFLVHCFSIDRSDLRFALQIFSDIRPARAEAFWREQLGAPKQQFYKTIVTQSGSLGTYRTKSKYGVLTVIFHNKKLRDALVSLLPR